MNEWILFPFPPDLYNWDKIFLIDVLKKCYDLPWHPMNGIQISLNDTRKHKTCACPLEKNGSGRTQEKTTSEGHKTADSAHLMYGEWGEKSSWVAGAGVAGESGMGGWGWLPAVLSPACPKVSFLEPQADLWRHWQHSLPFLSCKHHLCSHRPSSSGEAGRNYCPDHHGQAQTHCRGQTCPGLRSPWPQGAWLFLGSRWPRPRVNPCSAVQG